jgi:hypothetical protein
VQPPVVDRDVDAGRGFADETRDSARNFHDLRRPLRRWHKRIATHLLQKHQLDVAVGNELRGHRH